MPSYLINGLNCEVHTEASLLNYVYTCFGTGETLNALNNLESTTDFGHNGCQEDQIIALMNVYIK